MNSYKSLEQKATEPVKKLSRQSRIYKAVLNAVAEKKSENIVVLDLRKVHEAVADFFVICEATTTTQVKAISDNVYDKVLEDTGERPHRTEGFTNAKWIVVDYINIVIHIMLPEARQFYRLEEMWHDAPMEKIKEQ